MAAEGGETALEKPVPTTSPQNEGSSARKQHKRDARKLHSHGSKLPSVKDKKLGAILKAQDEKFKSATRLAKHAEILNEHEPGYIEPEGELDRTYKLQQDDLIRNVDVETAKKKIDIKLTSFGPYMIDFTRNGRELLLAGRKGHVATLDWRDGIPGCELHLGQTVRDVKWLHNNQYFAVAQAKYIYIYDHAGVELHCLKNHIEPVRMEFLPYHFLLASVGNAGYLKYTDTSTGRNIIEMPTKLGKLTAMCQNPQNAIIHLGHQNGTVTLWSPNSTSPLAKILAHQGHVRTVSVDREGRYMVTTGQESKMAVWDIRMFREIHQYSLHRPSASVAISDRDVTAIGWGTHTTMWRGLFSKARSDQTKVQSPYMQSGGDGYAVEKIRWCPFEDVLGIGHSAGYSSIIVPGAAEANYDALEVNPFETLKQRQEAEVKALLNKLQPEMISLNPDFVGHVDLASDATRRLEKDLDRIEEDAVAKLKNRGRGKNSSLRKYLRKKSTKNIVDERREKIEALRKETNRKTRKTPLKDPREELGPALSRFAKKNH